MFWFSWCPSPQGFCKCGEHRQLDAPGLNGDEVSGREELCAQRSGSSQRSARQPTVRQNQWLWALQGAGSRQQLLQSMEPLFKMLLHFNSFFYWVSNHANVFLFLYFSKLFFFFFCNYCTSAHFYLSHLILSKCSSHSVDRCYEFWGCFVYLYF